VSQSQSHLQQEINDKPSLNIRTLIRFNNNLHYATGIVPNDCIFFNFTSCRLPRKRPGKGRLPNPTLLAHKGNDYAHQAVIQPPTDRRLAAS
jgi:hypothetical protein